MTDFFNLEAASTCNVISAAKEEWHPMTVKPEVEARA